MSDRVDKKINRRDVLKLFVLTTAVVATGSYAKDRLNNELVGIVWDEFPKIIKDEWKIDVFTQSAIPVLVDSAKKHAEGLQDEFSDNLDWKPLDRVIDQGVKSYSKEVRFTPQTKTLTTERFVEILQIENDKLQHEANKITVDDVLAYLKGDPDYDKTKIENLDRFLGNAYDSVYVNYEETGSGGSIYIGPNSIVSTDPECGFSKRSANLSSEERTHQIMSDIGEAYNNIKQKFDETSQRVSSSEILAHFLNKNDGELSTSIYDTAVFLQVLARNDISTMEYIGDKPERHYEIAERFSMIKDEFSLTGNGDFGKSIADRTGSLDNVNKDLSFINQVGLPYHQWKIASHLLFMDRIPVKISVVGSLLFTLNDDQGRTKTASDYKSLLQLKHVDDYMNSFTS